MRQYDCPKKQAVYERKRAWRLANPDKAKQSVEKFYEKNPTARKERHLQRKYGNNTRAAQPPPYPAE